MVGTHLSHVLEAPDLGEGGARRDLGAVEDGHVTDEAGRRHAMPAHAAAAGEARRHAAVGRGHAAGVRGRPCRRALTPAMGAPRAPAVPHGGRGGISHSHAAADRGRDRLVVDLLGGAQLLILRLAQVVVLAAQVEAHAHDRVHARAVALDARVESLAEGLSLIHI